MNDGGTGIGKKTVRDVDVADRRVLVRADLNVPLADGRVADDSRIRASLPTIEYLRNQGARIAVCSHLGRPKGHDPSLSLRPVAEALSALLGTEVRFVDDCVGESVGEAVHSLPTGGVLLLENLRFHGGEEANEERFAQDLARPFELFVNDAFGAAHRAHASTEGVTRFLPAVAGFLLEKEVHFLGALVADPPRPFFAVVGGAKVSSKLDAVRHLLPRVDCMIVGGGMANTFLKANGLETGRSLVEDDLIETAKDVTAESEKLEKRFLLPVDVVVAESVESSSGRTVGVDAIPPDQMALDIGPRTLELFTSALQEAKAVVWNGPMGVFEHEPFATGSITLARAIAGLDATTVVGGGETAQLLAEAGLTDRFSHVSTGGGASLEMLEGKTLPGVAALQDSQE